jgi:hypothetical protein
VFSACSSQESDDDDDDDEHGGSYLHPSLMAKPKGDPNQRDAVVSSSGKKSMLVVCYGSFCSLKK